MAAATTLARGVYRAPYLVNGFAVLFAIDRHGVARKHIKITQLMNEERGTRHLELFLDRIDPPRVQLVEEPDPTRKVSWPYDHEALPPAPVKLMPLLRDP